MRKISLLFVLITVALLSSCVDDKESATVEQIRTAKTEWLKAQAEMLQAQGEAQKILAETEKLKAESEAKNEAARIEIERLLAEAQAAKTEAEADELRAQAEKIKQEAEKIRIEYEYQQKLNELAYQTAQAKEAAKQQEFINRLNEAIVAGKINKELQNLYADYVSALKTLRNTENQVSRNQTSITSLNKQLLASFDDHIKTYQTNIANYQVELAEKENELKEFMTSTENLTAEKAAAKINELKKEKEEIAAKIATINKELIELEKDQQDLILATKVANDNYTTAVTAFNMAQTAFTKAENEYNTALNGNNSAKATVINGFSVGGVHYAFPEFEQGIETEINAAKEDLTEAITTAEKGIATAEKQLTEAKTNLKDLNDNKIPTAKAALAPLESTKKDLEKQLAAAQKTQQTCQADQATLKDKNDKTKAENDAWVAKVKELEAALKAETDPSKKADIQIQLDLAKGHQAEAEKTYDAAKKAYEANEAELKKATEAIADLTEELADNETDYQAAKDKVIELEAKYDELVSKTSELNNGEYVVAIANAKAALETAQANKEEFDEIINKAKATIDDLKVAMEEAQKTMNEAETAQEDALQAWKAAIEAENNSAYTKKADEKAPFVERENYIDGTLIPAYNKYIKGDEFNDFTTYETYKQETIETLNTKIEDLKIQLAEETELLKEFQAAETDQEKEELINGAGQDYITRQIEQLEREITTLKEEITEYQANVDRLQAAIDAAEDALAE